MGKSFKDAINNLLEGEGTLFKGPYISLRLPFKMGAEEQVHFPALFLEHTPYLHQEKAFGRLKTEVGRSTLVATGTGKTECFLYPILDHCIKFKDQRGIKAILIYPMNALATDQARRISKDLEKLKNGSSLTAGLFIGGQKEVTSESTPHVIIDKYELINNPPDILLTNYKMLDMLLIRPDRQALWNNNLPETLKYLVVDELHTFDGAQGTDLACLIRRLKSRLEIPKNHLTCVGTSATVGNQESQGELVDYGQKVFGETFEVEDIITEELQEPYRFFADVKIGSYKVPSETGPLEETCYRGYKEYIDAQMDAWLDSPPDIEDEGGKSSWVSN